MRLCTDRGGQILVLVPHQRKIDRAFIREIVEHIQRFLSLVSPLFVAEHQVDPVVEMLGHLLRLKCQAMDAYEVKSILGPRR